MKPEIFIRAAAYRELKYRPGFVYVGKTHDEIEVPVGPGIFRPGFVTNEGKFVTPVQAARIALAAGQINEPKKKLQSEDLL